MTAHHRVTSLENADVAKPANLPGPTTTYQDLPEDHL